MYAPAHRSRASRTSRSACSKPSFEAPDPASASAFESCPKIVTPASTVSVTGPQVAVSEAKVAAEVLKNLADSFAQMPPEIMSNEAKRVALQHAHEQFVGVPFRPELAASDANSDDLAQHIDENNGRNPLAA